MENNKFSFLAGEYDSSTNLNSNDPEIGRSTTWGEATSEQKETDSQNKKNQKINELREERDKEENGDSPAEKRLMVIDGAKLQCPYAQGVGILKVTSNEIKLQDKIWATEGDGNNMVNLQFPGVCNHPKWGDKKPPCMSVINLSPWQNLGTTTVQEQKVLVKESCIDCNPTPNSAVASPIPEVESVESKKDDYKVLLVFYHGGPFGDGNIYPKVNDEMGEAGRIYSSIYNYIQSLNLQVKGAVIAPAFTQGAGVNSGANFINNNYVKGDVVIIYGYSYGGDNAVNLAEKIPNIPIDLMIIVDSTDGPGRGLTVDTSIPDNVKIAHNYYQDRSSGTSSASGKLSKSSNGSDSSSDGGSSSDSDSDSGSSNSPGSRGYPHTSEGKAIVENHHVKTEGVTHGNIQQKSRAEIEMKIKLVILQKIATNATK